MRRLLLLTGATGYVGGRLLDAFEARGERVRCLARDPERLTQRVAPGTEVCRGDVLDPDSLTEALRGVHTAYYLVHSMGSAEGFEERDRRGARNFAAAARAAGVSRIVYLGGLAHGDDLSPHLASRIEVGRELRSAGVPVLEFRASIVIGPGSASFEMLRALVERLPVMITPRWVDVEAQPIYVDDLLAYLVAALDRPDGEDRVYEVGGADRVSYGALMGEYADLRGLRRFMVRVPVLTPRLSSLWLGLVTPVYARVGRKLVESIKNPTVVRDASAREVFDVAPRGMRAALQSAMLSEERERLSGRGPSSRWFDARSAAGERRERAAVRYGNRLIDAREREVDAPPDRAFEPIAAIGGETGWYAYDALWKLRGFLDLLVGGVGVRRGRPAGRDLRVGDAVDFWRVEAYEPGRLLRLAAEMKLPGRAWLEFAVEPLPDGRSRVRQTATFDPVGLAGLAYWYAVWPLHRAVFRRMLEGVTDAARDTRGLDVRGCAG